jgi:hypothetical protein
MTPPTTTFSPLTATLGPHPFHRFPYLINLMQLLLAHLEHYFLKFIQHDVYLKLANILNPSET